MRVSRRTKFGSAAVVGGLAIVALVVGLVFSVGGGSSNPSRLASKTVPTVGQGTLKAGRSRRCRVCCQPRPAAVCRPPPTRRVRRRTRLPLPGPVRRPPRRLARLPFLAPRDSSGAQSAKAAPIAWSAPTPVVSTAPSGPTTPTTPTTTASQVVGLIGVTCPSSTLCGGRRLQRQRPHHDRPGQFDPTWTTTPINGAPRFSGLSCPTVSMCAAVDYEGNVWTSSDPTGRPAPWHGPRWCPTIRSPVCRARPPSMCVAVDLKGEAVVSTDAGAAQPTWSTATIGPGALKAMSCPTSTLCVAVGGNGTVVHSTDPDRGAADWDQFTVDTDGQSVPEGTTGNFLVGVSCPTASMCAAVDLGRQRGDHHRPDRRPKRLDDHPGGGQRLGGPGHLVPVGLALRRHLGGREDRLVGRPDRGRLGLGGGHSQGSTGMTGVSCASDQLCVAVYASGDAITGSSSSRQVRTSSVDEGRRLMRRYLRAGLGALSLLVMVAAGGLAIGALAAPPAGATPVVMGTTSNGMVSPIAGTGYPRRRTPLQTSPTRPSPALGHRQHLLRLRHRDDGLLVEADWTAGGIGGTQSVAPPAAAATRRAARWC